MTDDPAYDGVVRGPAVPLDEDVLEYGPICVRHGVRIARVEGFPSVIYFQSKDGGEAIPVSREYLYGDGEGVIGWLAFKLHRSAVAANDSHSV